MGNRGCVFVGVVFFLAANNASFFPSVLLADAFSPRSILHGRQQQQQQQQQQRHLVDRSFTLLFSLENDDDDDYLINDSSSSKTPSTTTSTSFRTTQRRSSSSKTIMTTATKKATTTTSTTTATKSSSSKATPVDQYFPQHAMMQHDILTRAQEMELGRKVRKALQLQTKMLEVMSTRQQQQQQQQQQPQQLMESIPSFSSLTFQQQLQLQQQQHYRHLMDDEWSETDSIRFQHARSSFSFSSSFNNNHHQHDPTTTTTTTNNNNGKNTNKNNRKKKPLNDWNHHAVMNDVHNWSNEDILHQLGLVGGQDELRQTLQQGAMARQTLITSNVRLVVSIAKQWFRRGGASGSSSSSSTATSSPLDYAWNRPSLDEVVQEGILGLAKAVERYDATFELRFGTYATHWITSFVRRCFQDHATGCLKVPPHYHQVVQHYKKTVKRHYQLYNTAPTLDYVAHELHVSPKRLQSILACTQTLVSLDAPRRRQGRGGGKAGGDMKGNSKMEDDGDVMMHSLPCTEPRPEEQVEFSLLRQCLEHAMSTELSPHERDVVRLRLGLDDGVSRTVRQVAILLYGGGDVHMSEIRAAEQRALKKLRSPYSLHTHKLLRYLDSSEVLNYQL